MTDNSRQTGAAIEAHYRFLVWLVPTIEKFPKSHKFTVGDRIQTVALDVLETLIEATYTKERTQHLRRANLGIEKLRFLLRLAAEGRGRAQKCLCLNLCFRPNYGSGADQLVTKPSRSAGKPTGGRAPM